MTTTVIVQTVDKPAAVKVEESDDEAIFGFEEKKYLVAPNTRHCFTLSKGTSVSVEESEIELLT